MREWLIALAIALPFWLALPLIIARSKRRNRGRKRKFGAALDAGFAVFDPAKARAIQTIEIHQEIGQADEDKQGELADPTKGIAKGDGPLPAGGSLP